jgi:outer membrane immunogenic protein
MKKLFAGVIGAMAALAGPALAADIPARMPAKAPPAYVAAYNWGGFYTASSIGGGWQEINGSLAGLVHNTDGTRWWTGSHIGIQGQWGNWVLGAEVGYTTPLNRRFDSSVGGTADCTVVGAGLSCNSRINSIWTVGGKAGYAFGNWMVYGAGGYANGRIEENTTLGGVIVSGSKASHSGWYAGGGIDWYVTRIGWSDLILGVEYRHIELENKTHNDIAGPAFNTTFNADVDLIMAKATFKWIGAGPFTAFR